MIYLKGDEGECSEELISINLVKAGRRSGWRCGCKAQQTGWCVAEFGVVNLKSPPVAGGLVLLNQVC